MWFPLLGRVCSLMKHLLKLTINLISNEIYFIYPTEKYF